MKALPRLRIGHMTGDRRGMRGFPELAFGELPKCDGFVKSPSAVRHAHGPEQSRRAALRFIFSHCGVLVVRLIPKDSRALHLELFTVPSDL